MGAFSCFFASFLLFISLNFHPVLCWKAADTGAEVVTRTGREAIEIIIGGDGTPPAPSPVFRGECGCTPPPPPEPECPPPPPPPPPPKPTWPPPPLPPPPPPPPPKPKCLPPPPPRPPPPPPPPPCEFENPLLERDYHTIQKFAQRIEKDPRGYTKTWKGTDICIYKGFTCEILPDKSNNALAAIDFNGANFEGEQLRLDDFLEKLNELAIFHANSNKFKGTIPQGLSKLQYMYELDVSNNMLSDEFPMEVIKSKNLTFLDLRFNNFKGVVPREAFNLDVDVLFINNNGFTQRLPDNIGNTTALFLTFANNNFTGPIPSSIGKAKNLLEVLFLNNQLSGCLPPEIGNLKKATVFDVGFNKLTGPIPYSFGCLMKMELLNLAGNELYGAVPEIVCKLPNIANLSLSYNYFTEVGPKCRKLIMEKKLFVRKNCILGVPHQRSGAECAAFFSKRRYCSNEKLMKWIPCKKELSLSTTNSPEKKSSGPASGSLIYGTLVPHGR